METTKTIVELLKITGTKNKKKKMEAPPLSKPETAALSVSLSLCVSDDSRKCCIAVSLTGLYVVF